MLNIIKQIDENLPVTMADIDIGVLARVELFRGCSKSEMKTIMARIPHELQLYEKKRVIIMQGAVVHSAGIVLSGLVSSTIQIDGKEDRLGKHYEPNDVLALSIAGTPLRKSPYQFTALRDSLILWFDWKELRRMGSLPDLLHEKIINNIIAVVANDNIRKDIHINVLAEYEIRNKVLAYLAALSKKHGSKVLDIHMRHADFAQYLCVNRSKLSKTLIEMKREGVIDYRGSIYTLP